MAGLGEFISGLFSGEGKAKVVPAPSLESYPSSDDAANALKYGFGYGNPRADGHVTGQAARVLASPGPGPGSYTPISGAQIGDLGEVTGAVDNGPSVNLSPAPFGLSDVFARAALAANRIPIAALGFDPGRMVADTAIKNPTVAGAYSKNNDGIYFNTAGSDQSTPVHESIHRGIEMLRKDPANAAALRSLPSEESVVRYIMAKQAGDPEGGSGNVDGAQKKSALAGFTDSLTGGDYKPFTGALADLQRAAEEAIKNRRPGGPR